MVWAVQQAQGMVRRQHPYRKGALCPGTSVHAPGRWRVCSCGRGEGEAPPVSGLRQYGPPALSPAWVVGAAVGSDRALSLSVSEVRRAVVALPLVVAGVTAPVTARHGWRMTEHA